MGDDRGHTPVWQPALQRNTLPPSANPLPSLPSENRGDRRGTPHIFPGSSGVGVQFGGQNAVVSLLGASVSSNSVRSSCKNCSVYKYPCHPGAATSGSQYRDLQRVLYICASAQGSPA